MPFRSTMLLCGGDGIELDWLVDLVDMDTELADDDAVSK